MVKNLEHSALFVSEMTASLRFYRDSMGETVVREGEIPRSGTMLAYEQFGVESIELPYRSDAGTLALNHVGFQVEDLDGTT